MSARIHALGLIVAAVALTSASLTAGQSSGTPTSPAVTFHKDVEPILQKSCQSCHRPGQIGPMALLDYAQVRPWARGIKDKVIKREMPPWFADPAHGQFSNDRSLKQTEIDTIVKWVDGGAVEGSVKDAPAPVAWNPEGWAIKPDVVVKGATYRVPKSGILDWVYVTMPTPFKEDTWVSSMEMRPGDNPRLLHHYCIFVVPHIEGTKYGEFSVISQGEASRGVPFEGCYEKGQEAFDYRAYGAARLIPANSDIVFQMHYAPTGVEADDQAQIGFTLAKQRPAKQFVFVNTGAGQRIKIAPFERAYVSPEQEAALTIDAEIVWIQAHAHYRAKEITFNATYPDGRTETTLKIHWDPNWQGLYYPTKPLVAPKGTVLRVGGVYDNSAQNRFNPDPSAPVVFGQQAKDEMLFPTYGLLVDGAIDPQRTPLAVPTPRTDRSFTVTTPVSSPGAGRQ